MVCFDSFCFCAKKSAPGEGCAKGIAAALVWRERLFACETLVRSVAQNRWNVELTEALPETTYFIKKSLKTRLHLHTGIRAIAVQADVDVSAAGWIRDGDGFVVVGADRAVLIG